LKRKIVLGIHVIMFNTFRDKKDYLLKIITWLEIVMIPINSYIPFS